MSDIPSYVPEALQEFIAYQVQDAEDMLFDPEALTAIEKLVQEDTLRYANNFLDHANMLEKFYTEHSDNRDLLYAVVEFLTQLPRWRHNKKTSAKEDVESAEALIKHLKRGVASLKESPTLQDTLNPQWRLHLSRLITKPHMHLTRKGKNLLLTAHKLLFLNPFSGNKLYEKGYITKLGSIFGNNSHDKEVAYILESLIKYTEQIIPQLEKKDSPVRKIHSEHAHIYYTARTLKDIFTECEVKKRQHVPLITDLINAILVEDDENVISEERIRKLIR